MIAAQQILAKFSQQCRIFEASVVQGPRVGEISLREEAPQRAG